MTDLWTDLPIRTYSSTVRRMMATAADMAIRTTWLFSLEMEKAAEKPRTKAKFMTCHSTCRKLSTQRGAVMIVEVMTVKQVSVCCSYSQGWSQTGWWGYWLRIQQQFEL